MPWALGPGKDPCASRGGSGGNAEARFERLRKLVDLEFQTGRTRSPRVREIRLTVPHERIREGQVGRTCRSEKNLRCSLQSPGRAASAPPPSSLPHWVPPACPHHSPMRGRIPTSCLPAGRGKAACPRHSPHPVDCRSKIQYVGCIWEDSAQCTPLCPPCPARCLHTLEYLGQLRSMTPGLSVVLTHTHMHTQVPSPCCLSSQNCTGKGDPCCQGAQLPSLHPAHPPPAAHLNCCPRQ